MGDFIWPNGSYLKSFTYKNMILSSKDNLRDVGENNDNKPIKDIVMKLIYMQ